MNEWTSWPGRDDRDVERGESHPPEEIPLEERQGSEYARQRAAALSSGVVLAEQRRQEDADLIPEGNARVTDPTEELRLSAPAHRQRSRDARRRVAEARRQTRILEREEALNRMGRRFNRAVAK